MTQLQDQHNSEAKWTNDVFTSQYLDQPAPSDILTTAYRAVTPEQKKAQRLLIVRKVKLWRFNRDVFNHRFTATDRALRPRMLPWEPWRL